MEMKRMGSMFSGAAKHVNAAGGAAFGFGGNGGGYFGNQGQQKKKRDDEATVKKTFGADGMTFTSFNQPRR